MIKPEYREVKYLPKATSLLSGRASAQFFVKELSQFSNLNEEECLGWQDWQRESRFHSVVPGGHC